MKGSYRIARFLKRFIANGFGDTFQEPEISDPGKQKADRYYSEHKQAPVLKSKNPLSDSDPTSVRQQYLAYQKETQAREISKDKKRPQSPGRILKLPLDDRTE